MKPFTQQLTILRHGDLAEELDGAIASLLEQVQQTGKTGEMILKLKVKPGNGQQVEIFDDVTVKLPKPSRDTSILFIGDAGLQREDPRQRTLEGVKTVADRQAPKEVRDPLKKAS